jgi:hypothetical protein
MADDEDMAAIEEILALNELEAQNENLSELVIGSQVIQARERESFV